MYLLMVMFALIVRNAGGPAIIIVMRRALCDTLRNCVPSGRSRECDNWSPFTPAVLIRIIQEASRTGMEFAVSFRKNRHMKP